MFVETFAALSPILGLTIFKMSSDKQEETARAISVKNMI